MTKKNSKDYWVSPRHDGRWDVRRVGAGRASNVFDIQREADRRAGELARRSGGERITQGRNGQIRSKDSFGNDPRSRKDREH